MKKVISYIIIAAYVLSCACTVHYQKDCNYDMAYPIPVSIRVGDLIDPEERAQFELFPNVDDFKSATFFRISDFEYRTGYVVVIETSDKKMIAVNRDPDARAILQDYIDRYEEIRDEIEAFEEKWCIIEYDMLGQPITQSEIKQIAERSVSTCLGGALGGILGFMPIFFIAMGVSGSEYNPFAGELNLNPLGWIILIGGTAFNIYTGMRISARLGNNPEKALAMIHESRKPKIVEIR